jgi:type IV pilus assembly protein PilN
MLIDINLLPKKEKKNFSTSILAVLLVGLLVIGGGTSLYYGNTLKTETEQLNKEIFQINESLKLEQERVEQVQATNSVVELKNAVNWAQTYPIKTVPVLQHLTALLPERGFIQQYSYSDAGTVQLVVQFDTSREAAHFLKWLNDSDWINEANIISLGLGSQPDGEENRDLSQTEYIPRYIGNFSITLEREKIKEILYQNEQGGDSE